ncbi:MAG: LacI family transcriptional regulator [candidate division KSB1 bacterium]|nr:LacI family transcriptional regulator [candidate division KSB1 bacterium]
MMPKRKRVTLRDLAALLNVTPATISKALRDADDISLEMRRRVKELAEEVGYQPNLLARSLVKQQSLMIGVVVPNLRISFFSEVTRGIYERARERGYEAIIMVSDEQAELERRSLQFLSSLLVDGILIDAVPGESNTVLLRRMRDRGIPIVAYDRLIDGLTVDAVTIDDAEASRKVVHRIYAAGKRQIAYFGPTENLYVARRRFEGYRQGLAEVGLPFDENLVVRCQVDVDDAERGMIDLLQRRVKVDAVVSIGGLVAFGAGRALLRSGKRIPDDVLLAEFGDNDIVARLGVPFLTVYQHPYKMGRQAVDMLLQRISAQSETPPEHRIIPADLLYHEIGAEYDLERP